MGVEKVTRRTLLQALAAIPAAVVAWWVGKSASGDTMVAVRNYKLVDRPDYIPDHTIDLSDAFGADFERSKEKCEAYRANFIEGDHTIDFFHAARDSDGFIFTCPVGEEEGYPFSGSCICCDPPVTIG